MPTIARAGRLAWILQYCGAGARSALSGKLLDNRLRCSVDGARGSTSPSAKREFDLLSVLANYDRR